MKYLTIFVILNINLCVAQSYKSITSEEFYSALKKVSEGQYGEVAYSFQKRLFSDTSGGDLLENESGLFMKGKAGDYVLAQNGLLVIQKNKQKVTVDSLQKMVVLNDSEEFSQPFNPDEFQKIAAEKTASFSKKASKGLNYYEIRTPYAEISRTLITVRASDLKLLQVRFQMPPANYFSESAEDETLETPMIIIDMNYDVSKKRGVDEFSLDNVLQNEDSNYKLTPNYEGYTFFDNRPKN